MEMKDIDLTKYNNCRFRVKIGHKEKTGSIGYVPKNSEIYLHGKHFFYVFTADEFQRLLKGESVGGWREKVKEFEIVPRDPETYTDWKPSDRFRDNLGNMYEVNTSFNDIIIFKNDAGDAVVAFVDELFRRGYRLVLTDIEQQIIEGKKKYEPQDGDIVAWKEKDDDDKSAISIYREENRAYFTLFVTGKTGGLLYKLAMNIVRPATEDEKQKLFDAMAKQGKRWNAEKKVVEDIPKPHEFKKGELVLVRSDYGRDWVLCVYVERSSNSDVQFGQHIVTNGETFLFYRFCIPYNERTMHLLGTSEDYREGE